VPAVSTASADARLTTTANAFEPFVVGKDGLAEVVREILEPVLASDGCELVELIVVHGKHRTKVRVFVDTTAGDGKIAIGQLERISRAIGDLLDVEDGHRQLFRAAYDLEVSSPGLDRPLTKKSHFERARGQRVRVRARTVVDGRRQAIGRLVDVDADGFTVALDDDHGPWRVPYADFEQANVIFDFGPTTTHADRGPSGDRSQRAPKRGASRGRRK
jgi:ribosome maturation factor RimP